MLLPFLSFLFVNIFFSYRGFDEFQVVLLHLIKLRDNLLAKVTVSVVPLTQKPQVGSHPVRSQAQHTHQCVGVGVTDLLQVVQVPVFELVGKLLYAVEWVVVGCCACAGFAAAW